MTVYVDEKSLSDLYGQRFLDGAVRAGISVEAVLVAVNAEVDAYVGKQVMLPPSAQAISQCKSAAARLAARQLFGETASEVHIESATEARRFLESVAAGRVLLHVDAPTCEPGKPCEAEEPLMLFDIPPAVMVPTRRW